MNPNVEQADRIKIKTVIRNLERRNIEGILCENVVEANARIFKLISEQSVALKRTPSVAWGGSATLDEMGIKEDIARMGYSVIDSSAAKDFEEMVEIRRSSLLADTFLTGTNAITLDGKLVNIDRLGNRVAAMVFGPRQVIIVAGVNKIVEDERTAISRIKTDACPPNALRLGLSTPCATTGACVNCVNPASTLCAHIVTTRINPIKDRVKVLLVCEELGF